MELGAGNLDGTGERDEPSTRIITGCRLKSGQHFIVNRLPYYGIKEYCCDIILNFIQNSINLPNIMAIIGNERELLNNRYTFATFQVRQIIESFTKTNRGKPDFRG